MALQITYHIFRFFSLFFFFRDDISSVRDISLHHASSLGGIRTCELEDLRSWESANLWTCDLRHLPPTVETAPWDASNRLLRLLLETPPPDHWDCSIIETRMLVETPPPDRWDCSLKHLHPTVKTAPWDTSTRPLKLLLDSTRPLRLLDYWD